MAQIVAYRYIRFRGTKGEQWLIKPESIVAIWFEFRQGKNITGLMLEENRRIELAAETPDSVLEKIHLCTEAAPIVFDGGDPVDPKTLTADPTAQEEPVQ